MGWQPDICFDKNRTVLHNPDVDGPGVITSFITTSWLTLLIVLCNYLFVFDSDSEPFRSHKKQQPSTGVSTWIPNPLDKLVGQLSSKLLGPIKIGAKFILPSVFINWLTGLAAKEQTEAAFMQCVLSLCDVQLITGISMLISGFVSLIREPDNMPLRDWLIINNLVWFSNLTHQCGLIFLRGHLYQNPSERLWRLAFMTILLIMLITSMVPTAFAISFDPNHGPQLSTPARCFYDSNVREALYQEGGINKGPITKTPSFQISMMSIVILFLSFVTRLIKLFETSSRFVQHQIRARIGRYLRKVLAYCIRERLEYRRRKSKAGLRIILVENPLLAVYLFLRVFADIYASVFSDVCWVLLSAIFGTKQLAAMRASIEGPEDDVFNFGQILPIMMLVAAILTIRQAFMSGRQPPSPTPPVEDTAMPNRGRSSRMTSIGSVVTAVSSTILTNGGNCSPIPPVSLDAAPDRRSQLEQLLSQDYYMDAIWLLPTLLNVGAAIFLFFQMISSSGGTSAANFVAFVSSLFVIISFACCTVILVGFTLEGCRHAEWYVGLFALQPFFATVFLSYLAMAHKLHFGELDRTHGIIIVLSIVAALAVEKEYLFLLKSF
ncbi:hypothetical protein F4779DRAFT_640288 [Xylariaceae sp. FL0662B]|nr:hypothetical protein F4779DRAFT_640288 [Xylariaceae sp. FL0662B]